MSLQKFGLDYIDLYLMHFPMGFKVNINYPEITEEDSENITNFNLKRIQCHLAMKECNQSDLGNFSAKKVIEAGKTDIFKNINDNYMPMREDGKGVEFDEVDYLKTYHAMESVMDGGQCRALGVSNFNEFQESISNVSFQNSVS